ncbi:hypothetical protein [Prochlorococcus marinus]|nr:hypothetical protein [Prochlorococcus marinus]
MAIDRIMVTPASQSHSELLNYWAKIEGRSVSSLCSSLLEEAVYKSLESGRANSIAIKMMEKVSQQRERGLQIAHQLNLRNEQVRGNEIYWQEYEKALNNNQDKIDQDEEAIPGLSIDKWQVNEKKLAGIKATDSYSTQFSNDVLGEFAELVGKMKIERNQKMHAFEILKEFFIKNASEAIFDEERFEHLLKTVNSEKSKSKRFNIFKKYINEWEKKVPEDPGAYSL